MIHIENRDYILDLVDLIYAGSLDNKNWALFIDALTKSHPGTMSALVVYDLSNQSSLTSFHSNTDLAMAENYSKYYFDVNPWLEYAFNSPTGFVCDCRNFIEHNDFKKTEFYNDWMKPQDNIDSSIGAQVLNDKDLHATFAVQFQDDKLKDDNYDRLKSDLIILTKHLQRAIILRAKLDAAQIYAASLENTVHQLSSAALILKSNNQLVFANKAAEDYFSSGLLALTRDKHLKIGKNTDGKSLQKLVQNATDSIQLLDPKTNNTMRLKNDSGKEFVFMVFPLPKSAQTNNQPNLYNDHLNRQCLVFIMDPATQNYADEEIIGVAFGLTPAESKLAKSLYMGLSLADHAELNKTTTVTARNQLSSIFQKMEISKQSDLIMHLTKIFGAIKLKKQPPTSPIALRK